MKEDFDPPLENNHEDRLIKLEDMMSDTAYYYFDVSEWESMIEYYLSVLKLDKATRALDFAKIQHPSSLELSLKEAELLSEKSKPNQAIIILDRLQRTFPFDPEIPLQKGNIYSRFGEPIKAIKWFKESLKFADSEQAYDIYMFLSAECMTLDKPNQAIYWLKQLMKEYPDNFEGLYELALVFEGEDRMEEGIAYFQQITEQNPYNHHAWFNLGNLYSMKEMLHEALGAYEFSVIAFDQFSSGWYNQGSIMARLEMYEEAIECFEVTLELEGPTSGTYTNIAECYENMNKAGKAFEFYRKALKHEDSNVDALIGAASSLVELNRLEEALEYCEKALAIETDRPNLQHIYAEVCQGLGFYREARRAYKKVIKLDLENWEVFLDYSGMLWENGKDQEAIEVIESGISLHGNISDLNYRAGCYLYMSGKLTPAFNKWNNAYIDNATQLNQIFDFCADFKNDPLIREFFEQF
jgi:tetratricopeptide (TPR) repeat protein